MVRVWYEPPPFGPATDLHTQAYGVRKGSPEFLQKLSRMPKPIGIGVPVLISCVICYIPFGAYRRTSTGSYVQVTSDALTLYDFAL